ncbi:MAG: glycosyltransferase [Flavobacterium sp.]|jgi:glycosyltransferase involved in cell wall biosynthesis|nr:glycosyltransferase [Flavobacterium sp.]
MQENPLVSVICLAYNHEKFVMETLNSVIKQNYQPIELLIVDDCSNDSTKVEINNWLLSHPQVQFIANEMNIGNTKSFNNALKLAKGEYVIDLAADDLLLPNGIQTQVNAFQQSKFKKLGVVYGNAEIINEDGSFKSYYFPIDKNGKVISKRIVGDIYSSVLTTGDSICSVSAMIKKSVFDFLGGYDETLAYEDLDSWIRASREFEFDFIDEILVKKRTVGNSLGSNFYKKNHNINISTYKILRKALQLNRSKEEDLALQKRVHHEIIHSFKNQSLILFIKNIGLRLTISWRKNFKNYSN